MKIKPVINNFGKGFQLIPETEYEESVIDTFTLSKEKINMTIYAPKNEYKFLEIIDTSK